jgi:iron-sulfur cluster assembly protein
MIQVTETAANKIKQNLDKRGSGVGIRVGVRTTGCSGLAYVLEYVDKPWAGSTTFPNTGFNIIVDNKDLVYLEDVVIDYVRQGLNEGFEFQNPIERDRCGCGESFRV